MDDNTQHTEEQDYTLAEVESAMSGRIVPLTAYQAAGGPVVDDLGLLERNLGKPRISPNGIRIGRLCILDCGHGWMKIELVCTDHDSEAELLPPAEASLLKSWIRNN